MSSSGNPSDDRPAGLWARDDVDVLIREWLGRWWVQILIVLGVALRLLHYWEDRPLWLDETSLAANIQHKGWKELFGPLASNQLAPPGFLVAEWAMCRILGPGTSTLRLIPLLAGVASLFLLHHVASRLVRPGAVGIAVALVCFSDELIYYSAEIKQYSTDVAFGLVCYQLALFALSSPLTLGRAILFAATGALIIWFSHASVFILAGLGIALLGQAIARREWRRLLGLMFIGLAWVLSFAGVHAVAMEQLGHRREMWVFWAFAFPRVPPLSLWDLTWIPRRILYFFVNPLSFGTVLGPLPSVLLPSTLFLLGGYSLARRRPLALAMLTLPLVVTIFAAYLQKYPFHGRLVLFLVPAFLMLIAEGADWLRARMPWRLARVVLLTALFLPTLADTLQSCTSSGSRNEHNHIGDRRSAKPDPARFPLP